MRVKRKKHCEERLKNCGDYVIEDITVADREPKSLFDNDNPVRLEIGCGKGDFIVGTAKNNPDINFLAVEKIEDVLVMAAEKVAFEKLGNVKLCCLDAANLGEYFKENSIDGIYLNFSDPWPKAKHYKRRLTYRGFLKIYKIILKDGGGIYFKTDNRGLFDFSLEEFEAENMRVESVTYDLHNSEYSDNNVMTEYERRFSSLGSKINRAEAYKRG